MTKLRSAGVTLTLAGLSFNASFDAILPPVGEEQYYRKKATGVATMGGGILAGWTLLHKTVYTADTLTLWSVTMQIHAFHAGMMLDLACSEL